jgi:hypothetical protein
MCRSRAVRIRQYVRMGPVSNGDLKLVALGAFDVEPEGLNGHGDSWSVVVPNNVDNRIPGDIVESLPQSGWRELTMPNSSGPPRARLFAAPSAGGWAIASISANGILSADPGPVSPRPGRPARRRGLLLEWDVDMLDSHDLGNLTVHLTNTSAASWIADPDDHGYVHGWLLSEGEQRGPTRMAYAPHRGDLPDLAPDQSVALAVNFGTRAIPPSAGNYHVEAVMTCLDLWSDIHPVRVV